MCTGSGRPRDTDLDSPATLTGVWVPEDAQLCPVATATPPTWTQDRPAVSALTGQVAGSGSKQDSGMHQAIALGLVLTVGAHNTFLKPRATRAWFPVLFSHLLTL